LNVQTKNAKLIIYLLGLHIGDIYISYIKTVRNETKVRDFKILIHNVLQCLANYWQNRV